MNVKSRMAEMGITQVDMILELQKRGIAVQPPMLSSILRGVYLPESEAGSRRVREDSHRKSA